MEAIQGSIDVHSSLMSSYQGGLGICAQDPPFITTMSVDVTDRAGDAKPAVLLSTAREAAISSLSVDSELVRY